MLKAANRVPGRVAGLVAAVSVVALVAAAPAMAAGGDTIGGGKTTLALKPAVAKALAAAGIGVAPIGPAAAGKGGIAFPITDGDVNPRKVKGHIDHSGGLRLSAGGDSLELRNFRVLLGKKDRLVAEVGGEKVPLLSLDLSKARLGRNGLDISVRGVRASLTATAVGALKATFGVKLPAGLQIGKVAIKAKVDTVALLRKGGTTLALDPGVASALGGAGISVAPIAPASAGSAGITFPITGGRVNATTLAGQIRHSGGLSFTQGGTELALSRFYINIDADPDLTAEVGSSRVSILSLDLSGAEIAVKKKGKVVVSGVATTLTADAAAALNTTFGTSLTAGTVIGEATVRAFAL